MSNSPESRKLEFWGTLAIFAGLLAWIFFGTIGFIITVAGLITFLIGRFSE